MFDWKLAYCEHAHCKSLSVTSVADIRRLGWEEIAAQVPGNFELDLMRAGKLEDLYVSDQTLRAQELEAMHVWYFTDFESAEPGEYLHFEGIDTFAEIYVNGELAATSENMFVGVDVSAHIRTGRNELLVQIRPACIEARKYELPPACNANIYNFESLYLRKAAYMFGWDIMPRMVSCGIWKPVSLRRAKPDRIQNVFFATEAIRDGRAFLSAHINVCAEGDRITDYTVQITGACGESRFSCEKTLRHTSYLIRFSVEDARLWWPKNAGDPNLYEVCVSLFRKGELQDRYSFRLGIRTVALERSETTDADGNGEFCFRVNGKKIFVLGTNWVPLDAFPSNGEKYLDWALALLEDVGCNAVRCWGGGYYESERFFDFCDAHGIMVWQDFAMGCATYPQDADFARRLEEEAVFQIKRLRNHASLVLWAGDNECDLAYGGWYGLPADPNENILTRSVLKRAVANYDGSRPYLPSSPYIGESAFARQACPPEDHLWGPRDYFKGDYYQNAVCHFASEIGYHGFPSMSSLKQFFRHPEKIFREDGTPTDEYLIHASCPEASASSPYAYRIRLAYDQVAVLFDRVETDLTDFVKQSQISQAEAKKYFIERFRIGKWRRTGIIWWNLIDGWPQISDAVVDHYGTKKLAYSFIKRVQEPVCLMFDEPVKGVITLCGANDLPQDCHWRYCITDVTAGREVLRGDAFLPADQTVRIASLAVQPEQQHFYLIQWELDGRTYCNHYMTDLRHINYRQYLSALETCGMDAFEGMEN